MPKKKRDFSLNGDVQQSTLDPSDVQEKKSGLRSLAAALDEAEEAKRAEAPVEAPVEGPAEEQEDEELNIEEAVEAFADGMQKVQKLLNNKRYQEAVKKMCKPMSVRDIIDSGEFRQVVPVVPDELEVEFRSMTAEEDLAIKKIMSDFSDVSDRYFWDMFTLYQQAVCLVSINKTRLPTHTGKDGKLDRAKLDDKIRYIMAMPIQLTATLGMHLYWFDLRVRELLDIERVVGELKNG